jgi:hypothetical protein
MRDFHMSEHEAMTYPTDRAFALASWASETNPWATPERASDGYIAQEIARLKK